MAVKYYRGGKMQYRKVGTGPETNQIVNMDMVQRVFIEKNGTNTGVRWGMQLDGNILNSRWFNNTEKT